MPCRGKMSHRQGLVLYLVWHAVKGGGPAGPCKPPDEAGRPLTA